MKDIEKLKKIELHLHLDGSLSLELASRLSGLSLDLVKEKMVVASDCRNLFEYLEKFDFPISLMQTKNNLELVAKDLINQLEKDGVIYAEIRFAPIFHTKEGLTLEQVIESVLKGLESTKVKTNLILCMMRSSPYHDNLKVIEVAHSYLKKGVVAIDLAGDENLYPLDNFIHLFQVAKEYHIPLTIHAGEVGLNGEIEKAIQLGVKRIGHGISCIHDLELMKLISKEKILLEVCPTSNLDTKIVSTYENHPIKFFHKHKILVSINTDNRTVSNISLNLEYYKLKKYFNFTVQDFQNINFNSLEYSFLDFYEKEQLKLKLKEEINN